MEPFELSKKSYQKKCYETEIKFFFNFFQFFKSSANIYKKWKSCVHFFKKIKLICLRILLILKSFISIYLEFANDNRERPIIFSKH